MPRGAASLAGELEVASAVELGASEADQDLVVERGGGGALDALRPHANELGLGGR